MPPTDRLKNTDHPGSKPLVSIITVNYNNVTVTCDMLASLQAIPYPALEIFVVDNGSAESPDAITEKFPGVHLLKSPQNLGFAGANNLAIRQAAGEFLFFLNNDTIVPPGAIEPLVEALQSNHRLAAVSPKILYFDHPEILQFAGYTEMNPYTIRCHSIGHKETDHGQYDDVRLSPYLHGAAMMVRAKAVVQVGLMAEIFFLYYEELDWCHRFRQAGYELAVVPQSRIYHKESLTTGKDSPLRVYYINRNRMLFTKRNFAGRQRMIATLYQYLIAFPKNITSYLAKGKFEHVRSIVRAWLWNVQNRNNPTLYVNG
jgi:GT2 family glycosyltransferase